MQDAGVKAQVIYTVEQSFGTRHYYRALGGDPEDNKA